MSARIMRGGLYGTPSIRLFPRHQGIESAQLLLVAPADFMYAVVHPVGALHSQTREGDHTGEGMS